MYFEEDVFIKIAILILLILYVITFPIIVGVIAKKVSYRIECREAILGDLDEVMDVFGSFREGDNAYGFGPTIYCYISEDDGDFSSTEDFETALQNAAPSQVPLIICYLGASIAIIIANINYMKINKYVYKNYNIRNNETNRKKRTDFEPFFKLIFVIGLLIIIYNLTTLSCLCNCFSCYDLRMKY